MVGRCGSRARFAVAAGDISKSSLLQGGSRCSGGDDRRLPVAEMRRCAKDVRVSALPVQSVRIFCAYMSKSFSASGHPAFRGGDMRMGSTDWRSVAEKESMTRKKAGGDLDGRMGRL